MSYAPASAAVINNSEYDVTGTIQVSQPDQVCAEVRRIYSITQPDSSFDSLDTAFDVFTRLFRGGLPGYLGCDTVYHDMQHSLDVTLAMARLLGGYEKQASISERLGPELMSMGIVAALFHDAGYIQRSDDANHVNGAQYTKFHVARSAQFLTEFMPKIGLSPLVDLAIDVVHFTGYERPLESLAADVPKGRVIGKLLGTADLAAQMSDRCYLEKCRDRLYSEFVLGGVAVERNQDGATEVQFHSGEDLLSKTPEFFQTVTQDRLRGAFDESYRYFEFWFEGENPYVDAIQRNLDYLHAVLDDGDWSRLRRSPPVFTAQEDSLGDTQEMVTAHLQKMINEQQS